MAFSVINKDNGVLTFQDLEMDFVIKFDGEYFWFENDGDFSSEIGISLDELESAMDFYDILLEMEEI